MEKMVEKEEKVVEKVEEKVEEDWENAQLQHSRDDFEAPRSPLALSTAPPSTPTSSSASPHFHRSPRRTKVPPRDT